MSTTNFDSIRDGRWQVLVDGEAFGPANDRLDKALVAATNARAAHPDADVRISQPDFRITGGVDCPDVPEPETPDPGSPIEGGATRVVYVSHDTLTALGEHDVLIVAVVDANDDAWAPVELIDGTRGWVTVDELPGALRVADNYRWHLDAAAGIQVQSQTPDVVTIEHTIIYRPNPPLSDLPVLVTWEV